MLENIQLETMSFKAHVGEETFLKALCFTFHKRWPIVKALRAVVRACVRLSQ